MLTFPRRIRHFPWPASLIERDVMHSLWLEAQATGQPITAIIKDAVNAHVEARLNAPPAATETAA
jgi:hypothetical protein